MLFSVHILHLYVHILHTPSIVYYPRDTYTLDAYTAYNISHTSSKCIHSHLKYSHIIHTPSQRYRPTPLYIYRLCVLGVSDQKFTQLVTDCASILAANPIAMTHTLASAAILKSLIYGGIESLSEGTIVEAALSGSGGNDAELKAEIEKVSVNSVYVV